MLPGARIIFIEVKTTKKKPSIMQRIVHEKLKGLGFQVEVVASSSQIKEIFI